MKKSTNRKAILVSALLTALILVVGGTAVFAWDRIATSGAGGMANGVADPSATLLAVPTLAGSGQAPANDQANAELEAYKAQLEQASQALTDAYAQIDALQAAQNQPDQSLGEHEDREHDDREHEDHEDREHENISIFRGDSNG